MFCTCSEIRRIKPSCPWPQKSDFCTARLNILPILILVNPCECTSLTRFPLCPSLPSAEWWTRTHTFHYSFLIDEEMHSSLFPLTNDMRLRAKGILNCDYKYATSPPILYRIPPFNNFFWIQQCQVGRLGTMPYNLKLNIDFHQNFATNFTHFARRIGEDKTSHTLSWVITLEHLPPQDSRLSATVS